MKTKYMLSDDKSRLLAFLEECIIRGVADIVLTNF